MSTMCGRNDSVVTVRCGSVSAFPPSFANNNFSANQIRNLRTNPHPQYLSHRDLGRRQKVMSTPLPPLPRPERPHLTALPTSSIDSELALLREQNQQLRDLVVQLSKVVVKQVL